MTIWVGNTCSHSFGIEKVGKPFFRMGSAKGEYGKKHKKQNNLLTYIQELKVEA